MSKSSGIGAGVRVSTTLSLALFLSGCGVIFGGTSKTLSVVSTPTEARLTTEPLTGSFTTPATLTLQRKTAYTLVVWKEGYREAQFPIQKSMRVVPLVFDILFTGLIGVVVDAATGGWWDLQPEEASVTLERVDDSVDGPAVIEVRISTDEPAGDGKVRVDATEEVQLRIIEN
jgi:hypothetical protein